MQTPKNPPSTEDNKPPQPNPPANQPSPPSAAELEKDREIAELRRQLAQQEAGTPAGIIKKAKKDFKVEPGTEQLLHVLETKVNGQALTEPRVRAYDPNQYDTMISKQKGYVAESLHDPRKA